jgi:hypothetical protein
VLLLSPGLEVLSAAPVANPSDLADCAGAPTSRPHRSGDGPADKHPTRVQTMPAWPRISWEMNDVHRALLPPLLEAHAVGHGRRPPRESCLGGKHRAGGPTPCIRALPDDLLDDGPPLYADTRRFVLHEGAVRNARRYLVPLVGLEEQREALFAGELRWRARRDRLAEKRRVPAQRPRRPGVLQGRASVPTSSESAIAFLGGRDQSIC